MISRGPARAQLLRGLTVSRTQWPAESFQPCLRLASIHDCKLRLNTVHSLTGLRHSSQDAKTSSRAATAPSLPSRSKATKHELLADKLNPPASTLPAPLEFPDRKPDQSTAGYWWKVGKAFWTFYKQGVKNINANRKTAKEVQARTREASAGTRSAKPNIRDLSSSSSLSDGISGEKNSSQDVSRSDWHLVRRSKSEMRRVPIFAVILAAFGEWTPLLVMFATPIVPYNCRIPRQIRRSREKQEERRSRSFRGAFRSLDSSDRGKLFVPNPAHAKDVLGLDKESKRRPTDALNHVCRTLNIYPGWQDALRAIRLTANALESTTRSSLHRHLNGYLRRDDEYLVRGRGKSTSTAVLSVLRDEEVLIAAEERGIDVLQRPLADVRHDLGLWLDVVAREALGNSSDKKYAETVVRLCLTRPNQWGGVSGKPS